MTAQYPRPEERQPRDAARWVETLKVSNAPEGALNVEGRRVVGPLQGFGKMWQKAYRVHLEEELPEVLAETEQVLRAAGRHRPGGGGAAGERRAGEQVVLQWRGGSFE